MKIEQNEMMSALMDGELSSHQIDEQIANLSSSTDSKQTWHRYHLMREALQGQLHHNVDVQLSERISTALEAEPTILAPAGKTGNKYLKPLAGLAIAASVTAAVLLGVQVTNTSTVSDSTPSFASNTTPQFSQPVQFVGVRNPAVSTSSRQTTAVESPMNRYLVNYNEYRANTGMRGMLPYVRIVGHESSQ